MPLGVIGLIPDGSTKVSWRWMGQVFEDSPDDVLQHSIVVRNLQELGVDSIEALKYLFPRKRKKRGQQCFQVIRSEWFNKHNSL
jgi:hypothetical protein